MSYFDYHAKVKKMIKAGYLNSYYFDKSYKKIGFALVLCFGEKVYPIKEEHFEEYFELIGKFYETEKRESVFVTKLLN